MTDLMKLRRDISDLEDMILREHRSYYVNFTKIMDLEDEVYELVEKHDSISKTSWEELSQE